MWLPLWPSTTFKVDLDSFDQSQPAPKRREARFSQVHIHNRIPHKNISINVKKERPICIFTLLCMFTALKINLNKINNLRERRDRRLKVLRSAQWKKPLPWRTLMLVRREASMLGKHIISSPSFHYWCWGLCFRHLFTMQGWSKSDGWEVWRSNAAPSLCLMFHRR